MGEKGEGSSKNMYKGHMDKAKGRYDPGWEVGMAGVGGNGGGKIEVPTSTIKKRNMKKKEN